MPTKQFKNGNLLDSKCIEFDGDNLRNMILQKNTGLARVNFFNGIDLNDLLAYGTGFYSVQAATNNAPTSGEIENYYIIQISLFDDNSYAVQIAIHCWRENPVYMRRKVNGEWSDWAKLS